MLISVVHQICTYALYIGTNLHSSDHHSHLNGAERTAETLTMMKQSREARGWTTLSSARAIPLCHQRGQSLPCPLFEPQNHLGVVGLIGKYKARCVDSADTVCVQDYHVHSHVVGLQVLSVGILSLGLKSPPAPSVCAPSTHQI